MTAIKERIIIGIDPGTNIMGFGVIACKGQQVELLEHGVLKLNKLENQALKLQEIFKGTLRLIESFHPDEMALEAPFYGENIQSMLKLGRAQGVAMAAALSRDIPVEEYAPRKIKMAITGKGTASKEQVKKMLEQIFKMEETQKYLDATDALAVAYCHFLQKFPATSKGQKNSKQGWAKFLTENPNRKIS